MVKNCRWNNKCHPNHLKNITCCFIILHVFSFFYTNFLLRNYEMRNLIHTLLCGKKRRAGFTKGDVSYKNLSNPYFALLADFFEYFGAPDWLMELSNKSGALNDSKKSAKRAKAGLDRFL